MGLFCLSLFPRGVRKSRGPQGKPKVSGGACGFPHPPCPGCLPSSGGAQPAYEGQKQDAPMRTVGASERAGRAGNRGVSCAQGMVYLGKKRATHALAKRKRKEKSGCPLAAGRPVSHGKGRPKLSRGLDFSSLAACNSCSLKIWQQRFPRIK